MIHVLGAGALGRALTQAWSPADPMALHSVRQATQREADGTVVALDLPRTLTPADTLIYAGGPAGNAACNADPEWALATHYTFPLYLAERLRWGHFARLVVFGTVLPETSLYGSLKALAAERLAATQDTLRPRGAILHLRCGQIIGPEMPVDGTGVVATWIRQAVAEVLLHVSAPVGTSLRMTRFADLVASLGDWLAAPHSGFTDRTLSEPPVALVSLGTWILHVAGRDPESLLARRLVEQAPPALLAALAGMAANARAAQVTA
jgi:hypothetical protein